MCILKGILYLITLKAYQFRRYSKADISNVKSYLMYY